MLNTAGPSMSVNEMIARQTRIERQEAAHCASVSFERHAANAFQSYVRDALAFSIKRGGILYGCGCCPSFPSDAISVGDEKVSMTVRCASGDPTGRPLSIRSSSGHCAHTERSSHRPCRRIDDDRNVIVECIYEPPQSATADSLQLERGTEEEQRADFIAELLGYNSTPVTAYSAWRPRASGTAQGNVTN